jgi:hypothetical protein
MQAFSFCLSGRLRRRIGSQAARVALRGNIKKPD